MNFKDWTLQECQAYAEQLKTNPPQTRAETSVVLDFALHLLKVINLQFDEIEEKLLRNYLESAYGEKFSGLIYEHESYMESAINPEWKYTGKKWTEKGATLYEYWNEYSDVLSLVVVKEQH